MNYYKSPWEDDAGNLDYYAVFGDTDAATFGTGETTAELVIKPVKLKTPITLWDEITEGEFNTAYRDFLARAGVVLGRQQE